MRDFFPNYSAHLQAVVPGANAALRYEQVLSPQEDDLVGGSVQETIDKILAQYEALRTVRYLGQIDIDLRCLVFGGRQGIELYATPGRSTSSAKRQREQAKDKLPGDAAP